MNKRMPNLKRVAFTASGRVQGVFYRSFTVTNAKDLNLTGYVKNMSDGTVQGEAQGEEKSLDKFLERLRQGPSDAQVSDVKVDEVSETMNEIDFIQK